MITSPLSLFWQQKQQHPSFWKEKRCVFFGMDTGLDISAENDTATYLKDKLDTPATKQEVMAAFAALKSVKLNGGGYKQEENAKNIQRILNAFGYDLNWTKADGTPGEKIDGTVGGKTKAAIQQLQRALNINADGVFGNETRDMLQGFLNAEMSEDGAEEQKRRELQERINPEELVAHQRHQLEMSVNSSNLAVDLDLLPDEERQRYFQTFLEMQGIGNVDDNSSTTEHFIPPTQLAHELGMDRKEGAQMLTSFLYGLKPDDLAEKFRKGETVEVTINQLEDADALQSLFQRIPYNLIESKPEYPAKLREYLEYKALKEREEEWKERQPEETPNGGTWLNEEYGQLFGAESAAPEQKYDAAFTKEDEERLQALEKQWGDNGSEKTTYTTQINSLEEDVKNQVADRYAPHLLTALHRVVHARAEEKRHDGPAIQGVNIAVSPTSVFGSQEYQVDESWAQDVPFAVEKVGESFRVQVETNEGKKSLDLTSPEFQMLAQEGLFTRNNLAYVRDGSFVYALQQKSEAKTVLPYNIGGVDSFQGQKIYIEDGLLSGNIMRPTELLGARHDEVTNYHSALQNAITLLFNSIPRSQLQNYAAVDAAGHVFLQKNMFPNIDATIQKLIRESYVSAADGRNYQGILKEFWSPEKNASSMARLAELADVDGTGYIDGYSETKPFFELGPLKFGKKTEGMDARTFAYRSAEGKDLYEMTEDRVMRVLERFVQYAGWNGNAAKLEALVEKVQEKGRSFLEAEGYMDRGRNSSAADFLDMPSLDEAKEPSDALKFRAGLFAIGLKGAGEGVPQDLFTALEMFAQEENIITKENLVTYTNLQDALQGTLTEEEQEAYDQLELPNTPEAMREFFSSTILGMNLLYGDDFEASVFVMGNLERDKAVPEEKKELINRTVSVIQNATEWERLPQIPPMPVVENSPVGEPVITREITGEEEREIGRIIGPIVEGDPIFVRSEHFEVPHEGHTDYGVRWIYNIPHSQTDTVTIEKTKDGIIRVIQKTEDTITTTYVEGRTVTTETTTTDTYEKTSYKLVGNGEPNLVITAQVLAQVAGHGGLIANGELKAGASIKLADGRVMTPSFLLQGNEFVRVTETGTLGISPALRLNEVGILPSLGVSWTQKVANLDVTLAHSRNLDALLGRLYGDHAVTSLSAKERDGAGKSWLLGGDVSWGDQGWNAGFGAWRSKLEVRQRAEEVYQGMAEEIRGNKNELGPKARKLITNVFGENVSDGATKKIQEHLTLAYSVNGELDERLFTNFLQRISYIGIKFGDTGAKDFFVLSLGLFTDTTLMKQLYEHDDKYADRLRDFVLQFPDLRSNVEYDLQQDLGWDIEQDIKLSGNLLPRNWSMHQKRSAKRGLAHDAVRSEAVAVYVDPKFSDQVSIREDGTFESYLKPTIFETETQYGTTYQVVFGLSMTRAKELGIASWHAEGGGSSLEKRVILGSTAQTPEAATETMTGTESMQRTRSLQIQLERFWETGEIWDFNKKEFISSGKNGKDQMEAFEEQYLHVREGQVITKDTVRDSLDKFVQNGKDAFLILHDIIKRHLEKNMDQRDIVSVLYQQLMNRSEKNWEEIMKDWNTYQGELGKKRALLKEKHGTETITTGEKMMNTVRELVGDLPEYGDTLGEWFVNPEKTDKNPTTIIGGFGFIANNDKSMDIVGVGKTTLYHHQEFETDAFTIHTGYFDTCRNPMVILQPKRKLEGGVTGIVDQVALQNKLALVLQELNISGGFSLSTPYIQESSSQFEVVDVDTKTEGETREATDTITRPGEDKVSEKPFSDVTYYDRPDTQRWVEQKILEAITHGEVITTGNNGEVITTGNNAQGGTSGNSSGALLPEDIPESDSFF